MIIKSKDMKTRLNNIIDQEVLDRIAHKVDPKSNSYEKSTASVPQPGPYLSGQQRIEGSDIFKGNIERFHGIAQIPVGLIGPLRINGVYAPGAHYVSLATTEGALVASYNRGAKVISLSGGAKVIYLSESVTRSPGFIFSNSFESAQFVAWITENFEIFKDVVQTTTHYGRLESFEFKIDGKYVWIIFKFFCADASGQNMVTFATESICQMIKALSPIQPRRWYIDANLSGDKKATRFSQLNGRGKSLLAEVVIDKDQCRKTLHVTPQDFVEYATMATLGGIYSGSIGIHGHFANALAAIFIACGQDVACVAESATGVTKAEVTEKGDLYVSISLPNLMVGTVGGGTHLPTQRECLQIMGCYGKDKSKRFAEICAATILAGEISIAAAIAAGHFTKAHLKYGRKHDKRG